MSTLLHSYQFRQINGIWQEVRENAGILADFLAVNNLQIDDRTEHARIRDYDEGVYYWYRVWGGVISIEVWQI